MSTGGFSTTEAEPTQVRREHPAVLQTSLTTNSEAGSHVKFQQLRHLCSGLAIVLDIFLCLLSSALMYLCHQLVKALEDESSGNWVQEEEEPQLDTPASSIAETGDSNAPTYKALYENEVEINHRVFQEMIALQHKLDDKKSGLPKLEESSDVEEREAQLLNDDTCVEESVVETEKQAVLGTPIEPMFSPRAYAEGGSTGLSLSSVDQLYESGSYESESSAGARARADTCSSPGPRVSYGEIFEVTGTGFSKPPKTAVARSCTPQRANSVTEDCSAEQSTGLHSAGFHTSTPQAANISSTISASIEEGLPTQRVEPLKSPTRRRLSHSAEKLLEEIVVSRANLKPRTKIC